MEVSVIRVTYSERDAASGDMISESIYVPNLCLIPLHLAYLGVKSLKQPLSERLPRLNLVSGFTVRLPTHKNLNRGWLVITCLLEGR